MKLSEIEDISNKRTKIIWRKSIWLRYSPMLAVSDDVWTAATSPPYPVHGDSNEDNDASFMTMVSELWPNIMDLLKTIDEVKNGEADMTDIMLSYDSIVKN